MKKGFTLVEILVCTAILSFMIAAIYGVLNVGNIIYKDDITLVELQQQARQAMYAMVNEIRESAPSRMIPPSGCSQTISFYVAPPVYGDLWVGPISYYLDVNDVNNDGVKDQIIRDDLDPRDPQGPRKILANDITWLNFCVSENSVMIDVAAKKAARGRDLCFPVPYCNDTSKTLKEKVKLRNRNE